jgi:hypothetical protein
MGSKRMAECEMKDCAFDPVEWGAMRKDIEDTRADMRDIKTMLGNGLGKRIRDLEDSRARLWGGLIVIGVVVPSIIGAIIKWL